MWIRLIPLSLPDRKPIKYPYIHTCMDERRSVANSGNVKPEVKNENRFVLSSYCSCDHVFLKVSNVEMLLWKCYHQVTKNQGK